ncbi:MAG: sigma-54-dependent transcriptional regulator [Planctomycetota bacterium]
MRDVRRLVMLVDDNTETLSTYQAILSEEGFEVQTAASAEEALGRLRGDGCKVVISDYRMPGELNGLDLLKRLRKDDPNTDFIMLTGKGTIESAVETLKEGAFDFLTKPVDPDILIATLRRLFAYRELESENRRLRADLLEREGVSPMVVGPSEAMRRVLATVHAVAPLTTSILIRGESGTGKEVVADEIHRLSPRMGAPLVKVNCAALPENLLESELFGHEKGAFTGATGRRIGYFEEAHGGTVFLDEIAEMTPLLQAKLLRVIQERTIRRVGGNQDVTVDVRILCATNKDLEVAVADGSFREDLYYRINVVQIVLPSLRERREDIPLLAEVLERRAAVRLGIPPRGLSPEALAKLQTLEFPGNVRELMNLVERAAIFARGPRIEEEDIRADGSLPVIPVPEEALRLPPVEGAQDAVPLPEEGADAPVDGEGTVRLDGMSLEDLEREAIRQSLAHTGGNMQQTARQLGISRSTLYSKVRKYGITGAGRDDDAE